MLLISAHVLPLMIENALTAQSLLSSAGRPMKSEVLMIFMVPLSKSTLQMHFTK
jgi:hypothetical protein